MLSAAVFVFRIVPLVLVIARGVVGSRLGPAGLQRAGGGLQACCGGLAGLVDFFLLLDELRQFDVHQMVALLLSFPVLDEATACVLHETGSSGMEGSQACRGASDHETGEDEEASDSARH